MALVTYDDKDKTLPVGVPRHQVRDVDMNELKDVINENWEVFLAAIGSDLDFADTIAAALSSKANITNPSFTGKVTTPLVKITAGSPGAGKFLMSDADGDGTWENVPVGSLSGVLPIASGGNGTDTGISAETQAALNTKAARTDFAKGIDVVGTKNGVNLVFTIAQTIVAGSEDVFVNGQRKSDGVGYSMTYPAGVATITFTVPPEADDDVKVNYIRP